MAKIKVNFNNKDYQIEESAFASASEKVVTHLTGEMKGAGATVKFGGTAYDVDSTKLSSSAAALAAHLGAIVGSGVKIVIGGVEYGTDSAKVAGAVSGFETLLNEIGELIERVSEGLAYTLNADGVTYSVSGIGDCTDTQIVIPSTYEGKPVTSIGESAFSRCTSLTSITIPASVTSIDAAAFFGCTALMSITIPNSVTSIGNNAFYDCSSLNYNEYNNGKYLGNSNNPYVALCGVVDTNASSFEIHENAKIIRYEAFYKRTSLTSINIPDSVTYIGDSAFSRCTSLTSITIPDGVTSIGGYLFSNCTSLTSITIPDSVTSIAETAFEGCTSLSYNEYKNGKYLGNNNNPYVVLCEVIDKNVNSFEIHENAKIIFSVVFRNCSSLASINIPDGVVMDIGYNAFYGCTSLTSVTIGNSVTSIGESAFRGCTALTSITIPDSVTTIGSSAFSNCTSLTSITIPDSVTSIGESAFSRCTSLTSVTIPAGVTSVDSYAFSNCSALTSIVIPDGVTTIGQGAFGDCTSLMSIMYNGTKSNWAVIEKYIRSGRWGYSWDENTGDYTIHCTDGDISKS